MMIEPQKLEYNDKETLGPAIIAYFQEHPQPIDFPVEKVQYLCCYVCPQLTRYHIVVKHGLEQG